MNIKQMIRENNLLQEQMTPVNLKYYQDMVVYIRSSSVDQMRGEELLLEVGQNLLQAQSKGKRAEDIFGKDPIVYCEKHMQDLPKHKGLSRLQFNLMIPWVALTWFFFAQALIGFITDWSGGSVEKVSQIRISTLLLIAGGSYILIKLMMNLINRESFKPEESSRKINIRGMGIYIAIVVIILVVGVWIGRALPVLVIPPWASLVLFLVGMAGTKWLFPRK